MGSDVHAELYCTGEIERQDVLYIPSPRRGSPADQGIYPQHAERSGEEIPAFPGSAADPCLPSLCQDTVAVRRKVGLVEDLPFDEFGIERVVGAVEACAGLQDAPEQGTMCGLQVDEVDRAACAPGQGFDQRHLFFGREGALAHDGQVKVALVASAAFLHRAEEDAQPDGGVLCQTARNVSFEGHVIE